MEDHTKELEAEVKKKRAIIQSFIVKRMGKGAESMYLFRCLAHLYLNPSGPGCVVDLTPAVCWILQTVERVRLFIKS